MEQHDPAPLGNESHSQLTLPLLPLKGGVMLPGTTQTFTVGRPISLAAIESATQSEEGEVFVVAQRDSTVEEPRAGDLYTVGTRATVRRSTRLPNGLAQVRLRGLDRAVLLKLESTEPFLAARVRVQPIAQEGGTEVEALLGEIRRVVASILEVTGERSPANLDRALSDKNNPIDIAYALASILGLEPEKEQEILAATAEKEALSTLHAHLAHELRVLEVRSNIASRAQGEISREQREYVLRQQLRAIQEELGEGGGSGDVAKLRARLDELELPEEARGEVERELGRLESIPDASPESGILRTWVEFVLDLPWQAEKESELDLARAKAVLDEDHFGLDEVKERILEHLAVLKLNASAKAPILCFVGPPGVGKTSLGQSVARAMSREFTRLSLGGLHDEAELRGHRRTYIGAMPGRILQALRRAKVKNPIVMLDEVDKLGRDFRGDPAAALLEVLDPEQNCEFRDNYLDLPFDLSKVLFITTANSLDTIPGPLLDRLEVIRLTGYSEEEKVEIAERYLIPREIAESGLDSTQCEIAASAVRRLIAGYTREGGVRELQRTLGKLIRKIALRVARGEEASASISEDDVAELLGPERFFLDRARKDLPPGVAVGLAWTPTGGEVLHVEATLLPETEGLTITGQLGDVMQESVKTARSYIWSNADRLGIDPRRFRKAGLHLHVPAGAIPKDGPSAGITLATALTSLYTKRPVRPDTAMTGEITLTGLVLPVGGVKEKVLAARRAGKTRVILSRENEKDLRDLPDYVRRDVEFVLVDRVDDVFREVLLPGRESSAPVAV